MALCGQNAACAAVLGPLRECAASPCKATCAPHGHPTLGVNQLTNVYVVYLAKLVARGQVYQARAADATKPVTPQTLLAALRPVHDQIQKLALSEASNPNPFDEADSQLALIKSALPAAALVQNAVQPIASTVQQARAWNATPYLWVVFAWLPPARNTAAGAVSGQSRVT